MKSGHEGDSKVRPLQQPLRICHVWDAEYPWDVRVQKISSALVAGGHDVAIVARNRQWAGTLEQFPEGTVHRLPPWRVLGRTVDSALMFPAFFSPRWLLAIDRTVRRQGSDVILVRDLPLAPTAIAVARYRNIPVLLDMAENYPAMLQELVDIGVARPGDWFVRNPFAAAAVERWVLPRLDHLITVVEESSDRVRSLSIPVPPITVVSNTPPLAHLARETAEERNPREETPRLVYLGLLEEPRGLRSVLHGVARLRQEGMPVTFDIIGGGREEPVFRALADELGLRPPDIRFHGRLAHAEALALVSSANIGLVPHLATGNWISTIPNKLFDYMAMGLAVVASDVPPVRRTLTDASAGVLHKPGQAHAIEAAIRELRSPERRHACGRNGLNAIRTTYHWEIDAARLRAALASVRTPQRALLSHRTG